MYLDEYLKRYSKVECSRLKTLIRKGDGTVRNAVINLLQKHKADEKSIEVYKRKCHSAIDKQFKCLMDLVMDSEESVDQLSLNSTISKTPKLS